VQALIWEAPEVMRVGDVPDPRPEPGWAVVRVAAVGICGSELGAYLGHNELRVPPLVMGHEWGGVVDAVGSGEDRAWVGRTVTVNPLLSCGHCRACRRGERQLCIERRIIGIDYPGAFAERVAVPVGALWPLSDPVTGALVEPLACAVQATRHAGVGPGDAVLVYGAGIIGLMSAWVAKIAGADRVFMVDTNQDRLKKALAWGVDGTLTAGTDDVAAAVRDLADGGPDVVVDAVGAEATRREGAGLVRRGGRVVLVGLHDGAAPLPGNRLVRDEVTVTGSFCYTDEAFRVARDLVEAGRLPVGREWLDLRPLAAGDAAFREQALGPAPYAKILLTMPKAEG
jgi:threonine dehydrogenase-like Zn-dependent dehydrogenase